MKDWIPAIIVVLVLSAYVVFRLWLSAQNEDKQYEKAMREHGER